MSQVFCLPKDFKARDRENKTEIFGPGVLWRNKIKRERNKNEKKNLKDRGRKTFSGIKIEYKCEELNELKVLLFYLISKILKRNQILKLQKKKESSKKHNKPN